MYYRLGKPFDAKRLAQIHSKIKEVNGLGIFVLMGGRFLETYYNIVLEDPNSYCLCAVNEDGLIVGYSFNLIDSEQHHRFLYRHKIRLAISALGTVCRKPKLIIELYRRYKSLKSNDGVYAAASGARGGYWGWDPDYKDPESSLELRERMSIITDALGIKILNFEVDLDNSKVYKFHKWAGAIEDEIVILPDGRKRALMHYDQSTRRRLLKL